MKTKILKITKIEKIDSDSKRYDLTIENNHNMFGNNILIHNCQNLKDLYEFFKTLTWVSTEKCNGSNINCFIYDDKFSVASRNLTLKEHPENEKNSFWKVSRELHIEEKMRKYMNDHDIKNLTLQGELIGSGIQKNIYKIKGQTIRFFRAFNPDKYEFFHYDHFIRMIREMELETVPILEMNMRLPKNFDDLIVASDGRSELYETAREGIVYVALDAPKDRYQGRLSFKVISNKFILKHDA